MAYPKVKGCEDFYPAEKGAQDEVFSRLRGTARKYGFSEVDIPVLESMQLLTAKSGDEIRQQIFVLEKRSKEELGLRFEFTAGLARMFIARQKELPKPVKWFSIGKVWRYEQPQAGRLREFFQFNPEIYGSDKPEADAEIINLAIDSLRSLGLTEKDFYVKVNNRKLLQGVLEGIVSADRYEAVLRIIDKKQKISKEEFRKELELIGLDLDTIRQVSEILGSGIESMGKYARSELAKQGLLEMQAVLELVKKDFVRFDISVARGLAYYTGTVFEAYDSEGKFRALCGGGRYDDMIEVFGGEKTPATGFGMGWSTIELLLRDKGLMSAGAAGPEYFIAVIDEEARQKAMELADRLRKQSAVATDLNRRNLNNQIKYAKSMGAQKLIVVGKDELAKRKVQVKDMATGEALMEISF